MIKIIADSTCDLSPDLLERYGITIVPLHVVLGEDEYLDGMNISPDEIYEWADANKTTPSTSAPSLEDAQKVLEEALANPEDEAICLCISEHMSVTHQVLRLAAEEIGAADRVSVVSTMNLSTGGGLLVLEAADLAAEGVPRADIVAKLTELIPNVRASFVVDTLTYLHRGGRCSGLAALAGGVLSLHPMIGVADGKMSPGKKYRGKMSKVILTYAKEMEEDYRNAFTKRVFITHSGCTQETIDSVREYLESLAIFEEILITRAGGVISSHCGPGTLGVLFISK